MNKDLEFLTRVIDEKSAKILDANDKIWEYAELAFHETKSAALLKSILKEEGFALTEGDAGIPTCFYFFDVSEIHELCRLLEYRRMAAGEMLVAVFT